MNKAVIRLGYGFFAVRPANVMDCEDRMDTSHCRFCPDCIRPFIVAENNTAWALADRYPVSEGHHLILPKRHACAGLVRHDGPGKMRCAGPDHGT